MELKRINNHDIEPVKVKGSDLPLYGGDLIPYQFFNLMALAKKGSGKTTAIRKVLLTCAYPGFTTVVIFAATVHHDAVWVQIVKDLEKKGVAVMTYTSIWHETGKGNYLEDWLNMQMTAIEEPAEEDPSKFKLEKEAGKRWLIGSSLRRPEPEAKKPKPKKPKYSYAPWILVFDDISNELKDTHFRTMLRRHRHYKAAMICASQWYADLGKGERHQIDIWLLWPKLSPDTLEKIAEHVHISLEKLEQVYQIAISGGNHNFLFFDSGKDEFRKNFTHLITTKSST